MRARILVFFFFVTLEVQHDEHYGPFLIFSSGTTCRFGGCQILFFRLHAT